MAIQKLHNHPEIILRTDAILCSINDRLTGKPGQDFEPLDLNFLLDAVDLQLQEAKLLEDSQSEDKNEQKELDPTEQYWQEFKV